MSQLLLFDYDAEIKKEELEFYLWLWEMEGFKPEPKGLITLSGIMIREDGVSNGMFFRKGYIVEVYEADKQALCFFPNVPDCNYIEETIGLVGFEDLKPITEYGFDALAYRENCPLPKEIIWRGKIIEI